MEYMLIIKKNIFTGYLIPKGWRVMVWLRQLHNDPNNFDDPMCFNPDRWDVSLLSLIYLLVFAIHDN